MPEEAIAEFGKAVDLFWWNSAGGDVFFNTSYKSGHKARAENLFHDWKAKSEKLGVILSFSW